MGGVGCGMMSWNRDMVEKNGRGYERTELIIVMIINVRFRILGILGVSRVAFR